MLELRQEKNHYESGLLTELGGPLFNLNYNV